MNKSEGFHSDSGTSGYESCSSDDLSERERRLAHLKKLAKELEATLLPGTKAWKDIIKVSHYYFEGFSSLLNNRGVPEVPRYFRLLE